MKKNIFILTLAFAIIILFYFIFDIYTSKSSKETINTDITSPLSCDLNIQDCKYNFKGKEVLISLNPKPLQALESIKLNIKNLGDYENLKIKIYGLNMYMGEINPKIHKLNQTDYESQIVLASCVLQTMRFRAEFMDNDKAIGFHFDFELKR